MHETFSRDIENAKLILQSYIKKIPELSTDSIPTDPDEFYRDFGLLEHPLTREPVQHLTAYQYAVWRDGQRHKYREVIKSQKVGITTSSLIEDFQKAITTCRGKEILVIAQDTDHAKDHLYTLRKLISNSEKYCKFLINKPTELLLKDEVTKVMQLFIHNPDNPLKPTRIIGLGGSNPGSIWSWKEVAHIHMSDIAASSRIDDAEVFGAAFSRLANTNGSMLIESPPRRPSGMIYKIYEMSKLKKDADANDVTSQFKVHEIPATMAVDAGLITQEFLDAERERLGPMYPMYYECDFYNSSSTWYKPDMFQYGDYGEDM
jgi:hypothetical protein